MDASLVAAGDLGFLDGILKIFIDASIKAMENLGPHAIWLALTLGILELTAVWALYDGSARITDMLSKVIKIGFFIAIIQWWPLLTMNYVLPSFTHAGAVASGTTESFATGKPSAIIDAGFNTTKRLLNHVMYDIGPKDPDVYNPNGSINDAAMEIKKKEAAKGESLFSMKFDFSKLVQKAMELICILLVLGSFTWIAFQILLAYIEFYIMAGLGILLLPFGVNKNTAFLSNKVMGSVVNFGIKLMVLVFLCGVIHQVVLGIGAIEDFTFKVMFASTLSIIMLAVLVSMIPQLIAGMLSGSPSISGGQAAGTAFRGAKMVGTAVAGAAGFAAVTKAQAAWVAAQEAAKGNVGEAAQSIAQTGTGGVSGNAGGSQGTGQGVQGGQTAGAFRGMEDRQGQFGQGAGNSGAGTQGASAGGNASPSASATTKSPGFWKIAKGVARMKVESAIANSRPGQAVLRAQRDREQWANIKAWRQPQGANPNKNVNPD